MSDQTSENNLLVTGTNSKRVRMDVDRSSIVDSDLNTRAAMQEFFKERPVIKHNDWSVEIGKLSGSPFEKLISIAESLIVDLNIRELPTFGFLDNMYVEKSGSSMTLINNGVAVSENESKAVVAYYLQRRHHPIAMVASEKCLMLLPKTKTIGEYIYSLGSRRRMVASLSECDPIAEEVLKAMSTIVKNQTKKSAAIAAVSWWTALTENNAPSQIEKMSQAIIGTAEGELQEALRIDHSQFDANGSGFLTCLLSARFISSSYDEILSAASSLEHPSDRSKFLEQSGKIFLPVFTKTAGLVNDNGQPISPSELSTCGPEEDVVLNPKPASGQQLLQFSGTDPKVYVSPPTGIFKKTAGKDRQLIPMNFTTQKAKDLTNLKTLLKPRVVLSSSKKQEDPVPLASVTDEFSSFEGL